jgi:serine/threonine-protein kinase
MNQPVPVPPARSIIPAGTQLNGIYEIDEPLAAGGMGEIYKGHTIQTGDLVAIKLIRSDLAEAHAAFALFRKEAAALHNLYHEAIVRYYVFTVDPVLNRPYLAMEYVDGKSLSAVLRGGPLALEAVHRLMQRIAAGLQAAHERGIIHRDVSPDNIIIPAGDMARAKIIDFGIARSTRLDAEGTVIGSGFAGKYNYVSPEQLGLFGGDVTPKSDIYSLGLVLAEALLGTAIDMGGTTLEVVEKRRNVPDLSKIDARLRPLIARMLQPDPADRPESMADVAAATAEPASPGPRRQRKGAGAPSSWMVPPALSWSMILAAGLLAAAGAATGAWVVFRGPVVPHERTVARPLPELEPAAAKPGLGAMDLAALGLEPLPRAASLRKALATDGRGAAAARFVERYDGGDCFFARAIAASDQTVAIEGFGRTSAPFHALDNAFLSEIGIEADIGVHPVAEGQCPALSFLHEVGAATASGVALDLAAGSLLVGQALAGTVSGLDGRAASVLVVDDTGAVRVLPTTRSGARDGSLSFALPTPPALGNGKLQLVLAVASREALESFRDTASTSSGRLFARALEEAKRRNVPLAAAAGSFRASD